MSSTFSSTFKRHFRDLPLVDKQKVLTIIMAMLRSTTFNKGTPKIPHNLQFLIDLAFTKIPTMDSIKFLINGNPDIDFDDLEGILTTKEHWTFFGVGSSTYTDGQRQVWYDALQVFITMDLPCDVDGTVHEDDFVNTIVNNIWEYRKYWCLGNNLGKQFIMGLPYSFDGMVGSDTTLWVPALIQAMRLDIFLGVQSESADLVNQARKAFGRLITTQEDSTFILEAFKNLFALMVQGSRHPERTVAQDLARMLHDALLAAIATTPLPSHVNQVNYNKMLAEILALSNAAAPILHYSMEAQLRITVDKHLREFLRTKAQLAMPRNTEPGIMAMQANQAVQFNFEQASAAASLGTSKQILADSTNSQQRGEHKSYGGNSFKNKRKGAYGNRREQYDENYDSRYWIKSSTA